MLFRLCPVLLQRVSDYVRFVAKRFINLALKNALTRFLEVVHTLPIFGIVAIFC
eukprot:UN16417